MKGQNRVPFHRLSVLSLGVALVLIARPGVGEAAAPSSKPAHGAAATSPASKPAEMKAPKTAPGTMPVKPKINPQHILVQHILIGFKGSIPGKNITRTKEEAKTLAYQILEEARKGTDFDTLVVKFTDDSPPGKYAMSNHGVPPNKDAREYARSGMVPAFGNVGFAISPGNIDIADYDPKESPYGWHIIKRLN